MPKSSISRCAPERPQGRQRRHADVAGAHERALGDLEPQLVGVEARLAEGRGHLAGEGRVGQLLGRDVDRDVESPGVLARPRCAALLPLPPPWRHASRSTHAPSGHDQPESSASPMNSPGRSSPRVGWCQRHEGLHADHGLGVEVHHGLVVELELVALEGAVQFVGGAQATDGPGLVVDAGRPRCATARSPWRGTWPRRRCAASRPPTRGRRATGRYRRSPTRTARSRPG